MTQNSGEHELRRCPRCGGRMVKPAGSTLFWHADNNHPRCDITNIVDLPEVTLSSAEPVVEPPKKGQPRKK